MGSLFVSGGTHEQIQECFREFELEHKEKKQRKQIKEVIEGETNKLP